MKCTYQDMYNWLETLKTFSDVRGDSKFTYAVIKNMNNLERDLKPVLKKLSPLPSKYYEFKDKLNVMTTSYKNKLKEAPSVEEGKKVAEDFNGIIDSLEKEYDGTLKEVEKVNLENDKKMKEETEFFFHTVNINSVPELTVSQRKVSMLFEDDGTDKEAE